MPEKNSGISGAEGVWESRAEGEKTVQGKADFLGHTGITYAQELLTQIPVVCDIPSLQNRRPEEKEMLIMKFFRDEEEALKRDIQVSNQVFRALMDYLFQENISQLKNCIKVICANAFFRQENEKKMKVLLYHLPESMLAQTDLESLY